MTVRDKIMLEVDQLPEGCLDEVYQLVHNFRQNRNQIRNQKKPIRTFKMNGRFDDVSVREQAYE